MALKMRGRLSRLSMFTDEQLADELARRKEARIRALMLHRDIIEKELAALSGAGAKKRGRKPAKAGVEKAPTGRKRLTRAGLQALKGRLLKVIAEAKNGIGMGELHERIRAKTPTIRLALKKLAGEKKIKVIGERRSTRYLSA